MDSEVKSSGTETAARSPGRAFIKAAALNHIHINVWDLTRSVRFCREAFGLVETFRPEANLAFMSPPGSQDSLALHQGVPVGSEGLHHFGFKLTVPDLDQVIEQVERAGGNLVSREAFKLFSPRLR